MKQIGIGICVVSLLTGCVPPVPSPRPSTSAASASASPAFPSVLPSTSPQISPLPTSTPSPSVSPPVSVIPSPYPYDPVTGLPIYSVLFKSLPVEIVAGSGQQGFQDAPALQASFDFADFSIRPCFNPRDNSLYIPDNQRLRKLTLDGQILTVAGFGDYSYQDGPAAAARFGYLQACIVDHEGAILLLDRFNHRIRRLSPDGKTVSTVLGTGAITRTDGDVSQAALLDPNDLALGPQGELYITDSCAIRVFRDGRLTTLNPGCYPAVRRGLEPAYPQDGLLVSAQPSEEAQLGDSLWLAVGKDSTLYLADLKTRALRRVDRKGNVKTLSLTPDDAKAKYGPEDWRHLFSVGPSAILYDPVRDKLYISDGDVYESDLEGNITLIAGNLGTRLKPFVSIQNGSLAMGKDQHLYLLDKGSKQVKRVLLPPP